MGAIPFKKEILQLLHKYGSRVFDELKKYVSRKFKQETGLIALEYLQRIRAEKSCELLAGSDMLILEIIHEVGYTDSKFFHKVFCRYKEERAYYARNISVC